MVNADLLARNARVLEAELAWFARVVEARFKQYFETPDQPMLGLPLPPLPDGHTAYGATVQRLDLNSDERLALVLALVPHVRPRLLDVFLTRNRTFDRRFTEFGGIRPGTDGDFWPTGETLAFLAAGDDVAGRFRVQRVFEPDRTLAREDILRLRPAGPDEPPMKAALRISDEHLALFTTGDPWRPDPASSFPAQRLETELAWSDLVLHPATLREVHEILAWIEHGATLMTDWGMAAKLRPGCRCLFYGPPGTGKTMTASLLGQRTGREVYRIDLSLVVSKYIGETEKNLARVFDRARHKDWILFFDEADALFGKRGETRDAHDRYANQEIAFLLQRIETFDGIVILASNLRENIDEAFARRFEALVHFPCPGPEERLRLWRQGFPAKAELAADLDLAGIAQDHVLSGGTIMNAIRSVSLASLVAGGRPIGRDDLLRAIRREYAKEGRVG